MIQVITSDVTSFPFPTGGCVLCCPYVQGVVRLCTSRALWKKQNWEVRVKQKRTTKKLYDALSCFGKLYRTVIECWYYWKIKMVWHIYANIQLLSILKLCKCYEESDYICRTVLFKALHISRLSLRCLKKDTGINRLKMIDWNLKEIDLDRKR